jgi:hypothetical protein
VERTPEPVKPIDAPYKETISGYETLINQSIDAEDFEQAKALQIELDRLLEGQVGSDQFLG